MEFITLPPEVTSALIHAGPGAHSLVAASGAWQELAANLEDTAQIYSSVLSSLTEGWHGASAAAMTQAAAPYVAWLTVTAQQSQQTAAAAETAAAAFTSTLVSMVHPSVVAANRTRLMQLLATNWFGINLPAIAETEQEYQLMWANNSAAMSRYQSTSQQATSQDVAVLLAIGDHQLDGAGRTKRCGVQRSGIRGLQRRDLECSGACRGTRGGARCRCRCHSDQLRHHRPDDRLLRFGQPVRQPVHLVRISLQHAQLCGAEHAGPGVPGVGRHRQGAARRGRRRCPLR